MTTTNQTFFARLRSAVVLEVALALCVCMGLGSSASAQKFNFTTFDVQVQGALETFPSVINSEGAITGVYPDTNFVFHGFLRSPHGAITTFDAPHASTNAYGTFAVWLNSEGDIVGDYTNANFNYGGFRRRRDGTTMTYRYPKACTTGDPVGCEGTGFHAINDFGVIAAGYVDKNFVQHALLLTPEGKVISYEAPGAGNAPGNPANISPLGNYLYQGTNLAGYSPGLNIWGAVTSGYLDENFVYHGYLRSPDGTFTDFDAPGAGEGYTQGTIPLALNDLGVITGYYFDSNNVIHGFAGGPGHFTAFDAPGADTTDSFFGTFPESLNDFGAITGYYLDATGVYHGFLLRPNGTFITLDAPGADLTAGDFNGTFPSSINAFGVITGNYVDVNFVSHGFVAVPCDDSCGEDAEAATTATRAGAVTTRNQVGRILPGMLGAKLHLVPPYRSVGAK